MVEKDFFEGQIKLEWTRVHFYKMDKSVGYIIYENYKKLSKSLVDVVNNKLRIRRTVSAKAKIINSAGHKKDTGK